MFNYNNNKYRIKLVHLLTQTLYSLLLRRPTYMRLSLFLNNIFFFFFFRFHSIAPVNLLLFLLLLSECCQIQMSLQCKRNRSQKEKNQVSVFLYTHRFYYSFFFLFVLLSNKWGIHNFHFTHHILVPTRKKIYMLWCVVNDNMLLLCLFCTGKCSNQMGKINKDSFFVHTICLLLLHVALSIYFQYMYVRLYQIGRTNGVLGLPLN